MSIARRSGIQRSSDDLLDRHRLVLRGGPFIETVAPCSAGGY
jgi:hypothetical protein